MNRGIGCTGALTFNNRGPIIGDSHLFCLKHKQTGASGSEVYAGKVEYAYCLSCDGALADRKEYDTSVSTTIDSWKRYGWWTY